MIGSTRNWWRLLIFFIALFAFVRCGVDRSSFTPDHPYSLPQVQKDYSLYRNILEKHHPGLYWYTAKDTMDHYFDWGEKQLHDSMTESQFRKVLTFVTAKINCGHTTVRPSKAWSRYYDTARLGRLFPLSIKVWSGNNRPGDDTLVVTANLNRRDSILRRGTVITKINGRSESELIDTMFDYLSTDGYNRTHKYQTLSNRGYFGSLYTSLFGPSSRYDIEYRGSDGTLKNTFTPSYNPATDTATRNAVRPVIRMPQPSKKERKREQLTSVRLLKIDSVTHTAMMDLSSFGRGYGLRTFFRQSFRQLSKNEISHLIIDVRSNGGGSVTNSTLISRFITDHRFKIGDSLYSIQKGTPYDRYIQNYFWNKLFMTFFTKRKNDGFYHFGYFERHYFYPKKNNHYSGKVYILSGGNSFSATTLFLSAVIKQGNVTVIGEETGGGAYGNSAWLIPDVTLPETGVRFRLPLFRLVIDKNYPKTGKGVQPEILSTPTVEAIRRNADFKLEKAFELISNDKK